DGPVGLERALDRARDLGRLLDPDADGAYVLGEPREVHLVERPQRAAALGLLPAIDAVEAALRLVAAAVVDHDRDRVDLPAHGRFDLGDVVPEASVAGERHHRPIRLRAFGAESRRECPTEMAGAAHVALAWARQIEHPAHPHAGVAGIDHHDGVVGYVPGQLAAEPLGPDRRRVRFERALVLHRPLIA